MISPLLLFLPLVLHPGGESTSVLLATDPEGPAAVHWVQGEGLVVSDFRGGEFAAEGFQNGSVEVVLGDGYRPRFGAGSKLYFERGFDDGQRLLAERTFVLCARAEGGSSAPVVRALRADERAPVFVLPPSGSQAQSISAAGNGGANGIGPTRRIFIDAGHGGSDPGGVGFGNEEADVVLDVALRLRDLLVLDDLDPTGGGQWEVLLSRASDVSVSLGTRTSVANSWGADRFVSIHANAFSDPQANGTETFAFQDGTTAAALRDAVQARMIAAWALTDRGPKTANFFVLVNTVMPATLSELGFMTNPGDLQLLLSPDARQDAALAHLFAIQEHYGIPMHEPRVDGPDCFGDGGSSSGSGCTPCPCGNDLPGAAGGCLNGFGTSAVLTAVGTASLAADTLRFELADANPQTFAVLVSAQSLLPQAGPCPLGAGIQSSALDGLRCVGGALLRHGSRATDYAGSSGVNGNAGWGPPNGPQGGLIAASGFAAGQTRHFQAFYRELASLGCGRGQNTTNAWSLLFLP